MYNNNDPLTFIDMLEIFSTVLQLANMSQNEGMDEKLHEINNNIGLLNASVNRLADKIDALERK